MPRLVPRLAIPMALARGAWLTSSTGGARMTRVATLGVVAFLAGAVLTYAGVALASHETFTDVPDDHPHAAGIHWIAPQIQGFPDGTFRPNTPVTRGQVATMMHRSAPSTVFVAPECGTLNFSAWASGEGSTEASVEYSMNGGQLHPVGEIPGFGEDAVEFTVHEPGVMNLLVDGVVRATANTLHDCTP